MKLLLAISFALSSVLYYSTVGAQEHASPPLHTRLAQQQLSIGSTLPLDSPDLTGRLVVAEVTLNVAFMCWVNTPDGTLIARRYVIPHCRTNPTRCKMMQGLDKGIPVG